jgi:hypothetical protein
MDSTAAPQGIDLAQLAQDRARREQSPSLPSLQTVYKLLIEN